MGFYSQIVGVVAIALTMASPYKVSSQNWITEVDQAFVEAKSGNKKVLLFFTLKDCATCDALESNIFNSIVFREHAANEFILAKVDFSHTEHITLDYEKTLLIVEKFNRDGFFPFVVIADYNGKILKKMPPYENESVSDYILNLPR